MTARNIPHEQKVYSSRAKGIYLPPETEGPFAPKPSLLSGHELALRELSQEASGL